MSGKFYEFEFYLNGTYMRQSIPVRGASYSQDANKQLYSLYPNAQHVTYRYVDKDKINEDLIREKERQKNQGAYNLKQEQEEFIRREERIRRENESQLKKELEELKRIENQRLLEQRYNNLTIEDKLFFKTNKEKLEKLEKLNKRIGKKLISTYFFETVQSFVSVV